MSLTRRYAKILSELLPAGAVGMSLLLGATAPSEANRHPADSQPTAANRTGIAERLASIRDAVSDLTPSIAPGEGEQQLAWGNWWRNGGWRGPGWRNGGWSNWRNGWRNGGWQNWWRNW
jgi:hypothetical protein